jgi:hypothetical protein
MAGQEVKNLAEIFMVDARILYVFVVKISDFFNFFGNLCAISKVALVVFLWLIFKLDSTLMMISFGFKLHSQNKPD